MKTCILDEKLTEKTWFILYFEKMQYGQTVKQNQQVVFTWTAWHKRTKM